MPLDIVLLLVGLAVLVKFSTLTIKNAVRFSYLTGINQLTVGFIIIAVATSLPELSIAVMSSLRGEGLLSLGNVTGANVANLALIFGLISFLGFRVKKFDIAESEKIVLISAVIALFILILGKLDYAFGIFALVVFYVFSKTIVKEGIKVKERVKGLRSVESVKALFYLLVSIAVVIVSTNFVTDSAIRLAHLFGIATSVVGATIVSIGTTLPELSIGIAAIRRKNVELAVGDAIGSVITNITLILGIAALISPIVLGYAEISGLIMLLVVNLIFMLLMSAGVFRKTEGVFLLVLYAVFLAVMITVGGLS